MNPSLESTDGINAINDQAYNLYTNLINGQCGVGPVFSLHKDFNNAVNYMARLYVELTLSKDNGNIEDQLHYAKILNQQLEFALEEHTNIEKNLLETEGKYKKRDTLPLLQEGYEEQLKAGRQLLELVNSPETGEDVSTHFHILPPRIFPQPRDTETVRLDILGHMEDLANSVLVIKNTIKLNEALAPPVQALSDFLHAHNGQVSAETLAQNIAPILQATPLEMSEPGLHFNSPWQPR